MIPPAAIRLDIHDKRFNAAIAVDIACRIGSAAHTADVNLPGGQRLDDAGIVGGRENLDLHPKLLLHVIGEGLVACQRGRLRFNCDRTNLENLVFFPPVGGTCRSREQRRHSRNDR